METPQEVEDYSRYLNHLMLKSSDPFIRKKYKAYLSNRLCPDEGPDF